MALKFKAKKVTLGKGRVVTKMGEEEARLVGKKVIIPPPPVRDIREEGTLYDEQQVLRVENLMLKGIRHRQTLMEQLKIPSLRSLDRYMARVYARWEMVGMNQDYGRARGESLQRLDMIDDTIWTRLRDNPKNHKLFISLIKTTLMVQAQRAEVLGLTPKVIERIGTIEEGTLVFSKQAAVHERLSMLAARMLEVMKERMNSQQTSTVIEHDASPPKD